METVVEVVALEDYRLKLRFDDGVSGTVDLSDDLWGPMFEPLRDPKLFAQVFVDEFGAVCWPNGADYAPDALYKMVTDPVHANGTNED